MSETFLPTLCSTIVVGRALLTRARAPHLALLSTSMRLPPAAAPPFLACAWAMRAYSASRSFWKRRLQGGARHGKHSKIITMHQTLVTAAHGLTLTAHVVYLRIHPCCVSLTKVARASSFLLSQRLSGWQRHLRRSRLSLKVGVSMPFSGVHSSSLRCTARGTSKGCTQGTIG